MKEETEEMKYEPYVWYGVNVVLPYPGDRVLVCDKHTPNRFEVSSRSLKDKDKIDRNQFLLVGDMEITHWMRVEDLDLSKAKDIDWSKSVEEIDRQLYDKYDLTEQEVEFIEKTVKPMS